MTDALSRDESSLRQRLEALRDELLALSAGTAQDRRPVTLDQQSVGRLSRIDALQQQALSQATESKRQTEIRRIDAALARLAAGEYGWCLRCGEAIAPARLTLDPAVAVCVDCAGR